MKSVRVFEEVAREQFINEIVPLYQPAVLKNALADWPLVEKAKQGAKALNNYLLLFDRGCDVGVFRTNVNDAGRIVYRNNYREFNFIRQRASFKQCLDEIFSLSNGGSISRLYMGSTPAEHCLPGLMAKNSMPLLSDAVNGRLWIGNESLVQPHFDVSDNIAVVVAGKRRFTLFPPEQIKNLYVGPIDTTPAGQPMSVVPLNEPDVERYPRYQEALENSQVAELGPGDAIFIPSLWWHGVEALSPFNMLVNYWWNEHAAGSDSAHEAMIHAMLTISHLPLAERKAWKAFFDHYVFRESEHPLEHLPEDARGVLASMTPECYRMLSNAKNLLVSPDGDSQ